MKNKLKNEILKLLEEKYPSMGVFSFGDGIYNIMTFHPRTQLLCDDELFGWVEIQNDIISIIKK